MEAREQFEKLMRKRPDIAADNGFLCRQSDGAGGELDGYVESDIDLAWYAYKAASATQAKVEPVAPYAWVLEYQTNDAFDIPYQRRDIQFVDPGGRAGYAHCKVTPLYTSPTPSQDAVDAERAAKAEKALVRVERAIDLHLGRSAWTQTQNPKGSAYSEAVRKELYAAHDQVRAAIASTK